NLGGGYSLRQANEARVASTGRTARPARAAHDPGEDRPQGLHDPGPLRDRLRPRLRRPLPRAARDLLAVLGRLWPAVPAGPEALGLGLSRIVEPDDVLLVGAPAVVAGRVAVDLG